MISKRNSLRLLVGFSLGLLGSEVFADTYDLATFEKLAMEQSKGLRPSKQPAVAAALKGAGCRIIMAGERPGVVARTSHHSMQTNSMGEIVFATCGQGTTFTLESTVKARLDSSRGAGGISNEVTLTSEPDAAGMQFGRLRAVAGRERPYIVAWRNASGRQFILTRYDTFDQSQARISLLDLARNVIKALPAD